jgi:hypothetical protein
MSVELLLVLRPGIGIGAHGQALLAELEPFERARATRGSWPGTVLVGDRAEVRTYSTSATASDTLCSAAAGLYDWVQPNLPEDPCFLRGDGTPLLWTIGHEAAAYLELQQDEVASVLERVPDLRLNAA